MDVVGAQIRHREQAKNSSVRCSWKKLYYEVCPCYVGMACSNVCGSHVMAKGWGVCVFG